MTYQNTTIPAPTNPGPTLEESYAALKEEGLVSDDAEGASTVVNTDAQGGADGSQEENAQTGGDTGERPSWLPEEFASEAEFREWYASVKNGDDETDEEEGTDEAPAEPTSEERAAAEEATKKAGLDLTKVSDEYWANGGLTDKTYEALDKAGYPKELVDVYIEGLVSRNSKIETSVYEMVGSKDAYGELIQFAIDNLTNEQQEAFDREINSGSKVRVMNAVKALKADQAAFLAKNASVEPEETIESKSGKRPENTYKHLDDYLADLNDPRYEKSETFRRQVATKLDRSNIM